jgi:hypothetical protein
MKKLFLMISLASAVAFANAQDMTSKKGVPILPEANDWSIGFDATNLIRYFGNMFSQAGNNNSTLGPEESLTLVGLMVKDETTSYRAKLSLGFGSSTTEGPPASGDSTNNPSKTEMSNGFSVTLGGGIQKNRGKGRLRGIYGAEAQIMFASGSTTTNTYAQAVDASHMPSPYRTTEASGGSTFGFGINGFIGAEYFFAPKMSISAEYGWGISISSTGESETTVEGWNPTLNSGNGAVETITSKGSSSSAFSIGNSDAGSITFHCYF